MSAMSLRLPNSLGAEQCLRRRGREGRLAGQQLIGHHAEGVEVGPVIDVRIGRGLLRGHVGRGA